MDVGLGNENLMFYSKDSDICIAIFSASNAMENNNPNIDDLMFSIYEIFE